MATPSPPLRVVVVDDERTVADTLGLILERHGAEVTVCYDPRQAIIAGKVHQPQALISDVVMPFMSGFELARYYGHHHPDCRVLLLSGNANANLMAREAETTGPVPAFLQKPVHPSLILAFIDSCMAAV